MTSTFSFAVLCIGVAQGLVLAFALAGKESNNRGATRMLAALVAAFTALLATELAELFLTSRPRLFLTAWAINLELAIGPLLFFFFRALVEGDPGLRRSSWKHALPLILGVLSWTTLVIFRSGVRIDLDDPIYGNWVAGWVLVKAVIFYSYLAAAVRLLPDDGAHGRELVAGRRQIRKGWLRRWLLGVAAATLLIYGSAFATWAGVDRGFEADAVGSLVLAVLIYLLSALVLLRPWILSIRPTASPDAQLRTDCKRLEAHLSEHRPYLDPELRLDDLARALGMTSQRLSAVVNEGLGCGFYPLVNRYRLRRFEELVERFEAKDRTVLDLAFEAGFNSKAVFYRVFRETHGTTPTAYRRKNQ